MAAPRPLRYLTKSLVRTALKCPRKLVYATNPTLYPRRSDEAEDPLSKYLAQEGQRFGEYCKGMFPHGVEIGKDVDNVASPASMETLVAQTHDMLMEGNDQRVGGERVTVFEGAVRHGRYYVRPDILDKTTGEKGTGPDIRVIEVKSKSWDSQHTVESKMWTAKKTIRGTFLPYIQDVAFQKMVVGLSYDARVSAWLMLPDRAKRMRHNPDDEDEYMADSSVPTFDDTLQTIDGSIAALINVDDLVEVALSSEVQYPGSKKGETFTDAVHRWAEQLNDEQFGSDSFVTSVGTQCASCEYRLKEATDSAHSGFDICWRKASGTEAEESQRSPPVVDLFGNAKVAVKKFTSEGKYFLSDLTRSDFDALEKNKLKPSGGITTHQRQWYQVQASQRNKVSDAYHHPNYITRRNHMERAMKHWKYPHHFIDFETAAPGIPFYPNKSPYETVAFQFSHHVVSQNDDGSLAVQHKSEFLHTEQGVCPNISFLKALHRSIGSVATDGGTVFQWSPHESNVLRVMLSSPEVSDSLSPEELSALTAVQKSLVDLCKIAQKYYYVDGSDGSSSMKRLLKSTMNASPHLKSIYGTSTYNGTNFNDFQWYQQDDHGEAMDPYDILSGTNAPDQHESANIAVGGAAASAFNELHTNMELTDQDRMAIESSLLRYCELDTLAMVMIVQAWQGFLGEEADIDPQ